MSQLAPLPCETPLPDFSQNFDTAAYLLRLSVRHLLNAMDKGHFDHRLTVAGCESAYVLDLREALARLEALS